MEIKAAPPRFDAQIFRLHLHVAVADQRYVEPPERGGEISEFTGFARRPIIERAIAARAAIFVDEIAGIASAGLAKFAGKRCGLLLWGLFGQKTALHQCGDRAGKRFAIMAKSFAKLGKVFRQTPRYGKGREQRRRIAVDGDAQLRHGVQDERPIGAERQ